MKKPISLACNLVLFAEKVTTVHVISYFASNELFSVIGKIQLGRTCTTCRSRRGPAPGFCI